MAPVTCMLTTQGTHPTSAGGSATFMPNSSPEADPGCLLCYATFLLSQLRLRSLSPSTRAVLYPCASLHVTLHADGRPCVPPTIFWVYTMSPDCSRVLGLQDERKPGELGLAISPLLQYLV